ncbi:glutamine amidotransferase-related protein, partial [Micromonospora arida]
PGPGDPATADAPVELAREALRREVPLFGICFGSQILGRALGFGTYKLGYGHRGINQPVLDRVTGKVEVTSHNHGFAVQVPGAGVGAVVPDQVIDTDFGGVRVSHVCLNDNVVEGLRAVDLPAFTVQYHPEAAAGPHDADYLFDRFAELIEGRALDRRPSEGRTHSKGRSNA